MAALTIKKETVKNLNLTQEIITDVKFDMPTINIDFGADLLKFLGTISFIKPNGNMNMYLNIKIYNDMDCTNLIGGREISSNNLEDKNYFQVFFSNNETSKWINAEDPLLVNGFGSEFDKRPVVFQIGKWLKDFANITTFDSETKYYILYTWSNVYDNTEESETKSDINSIIWPNFENR